MPLKSVHTNLKKNKAAYETKLYGMTNNLDAFPAKFFVHTVLGLRCFPFELYIWMLCLRWHKMAQNRKCSSIDFMTLYLTTLNSRSDNRWLHFHSRTVHNVPRRVKFRCRAPAKVTVMLWITWNVWGVKRDASYLQAVLFAILASPATKEKSKLFPTKIGGITSKISAWKNKHIYNFIGGWNLKQTNKQTNNFEYVCLKGRKILKSS